MLIFPKYGSRGPNRLVLLIDRSNHDLNALSSRGGLGKERRESRKMGHIKNILTCSRNSRHSRDLAGQPRGEQGTRIELWPF
jgi:hypothetical protein